MATNPRRIPFARLYLSVLPQTDDSVSVGIVFRDRGGTGIARLAYVQDESDLAEATYKAVLTALSHAERIGVQRAAVYLDDPRIVERLNRRATPEEDLQLLFVQIRCRANAMGRVRFHVGAPDEMYAATQLAVDASSTGEAISVVSPHAAPHLPLLFEEDAA